MTGPMKRVELVRFMDDGEATLGRLKLMGVFGYDLAWHRTEGLLYTVERPWMDNQPNVSCIPEGSYRLVPRFYNRRGYPSYMVEDVEGRDYIMFHRANWAADVRGCIGVGVSAGTLNGRLAVRDSRLGFSRFMLAMEDAPEAILTVSYYR